MKRSVMNLLAVLLLLLFPTLAYPADVIGKLTVLHGKDVVLESANSFYGLTDVEAMKLTKSAAAQLDYASKQQDKGGDYTIRFQWKDLPAVETQGMKLQAVINTLRRGTWWLASVVDETDAKAKQGKKHWGK